MQQTIVMDLDFITSSDADQYLWGKVIPKIHGADLTKIYERTKEKLDLKWFNLNVWNKGEKINLADYWERASLKENIEFTLHQLKEAGFYLELNTRADPDLIKIWLQKYSGLLKLFDNIERKNKISSENNGKIIFDKTTGTQEALVFSSDYHPAEIIDLLYPHRATITNPNINGVTTSIMPIPDLSFKELPEVVVVTDSEKLDVIRLNHKSIEGEDTGNSIYKKIFGSFFLRIPSNPKAVTKMYEFANLPHDKEYEKLERKALNLIKDYTDKNSKILDLGCGTGSLLDKLKLDGYTDLSGLDVINRNVNHNFFKQDFYEQFQIDKFDLISMINLYNYETKVYIDKISDNVQANLKENGIVLCMASKMDPIISLKERLQLIEQGVYEFKDQSIVYSVLRKD